MAGWIDGLLIRWFAGWLAGWLVGRSVGGWFVHWTVGRKVPRGDGVEFVVGGVLVICVVPYTLALVIINHALHIS